MIETMRAADGAGLAANQVGETLRVAVVEVQAGQPALPLQAADPAHRDREPGDRAARRRGRADQRGLPVRAEPARRGAAPREHPAALPRPRRSRARGGQARPDRRDVPARARPPRRHPVRRPGRATRARSPPGRSSSASTGTSSWSVRAGSSSGWARDERTGASSPGSAGPARSRAWWWRSRTAASRRWPSGTPAPPPGARRLDGLTLPGLANAHSHAFQRALRGRTQHGSGSFWTWREQMYALAERLDPESYLALARATYAEMALAGVTTVGEFHYLHHGPRRRRATTTPTRWAGRSSPRPPRPAYGSR